MIHIGLTGGIGSGKSTVARLFEQRGAHIVDLDLLAHQVEEPGGAAWEGIVEHFGRDILDTEGKIDREKLGGIVFRDAAKREALNRIVHPAVRDAWRRRIDDIGRGDGRAIVISDVPLLIEVGWHEKTDIVILVYVPPEVQVERIVRRNGLTDEEARDRLRSQMPLADKIPFADFVIRNEGTFEETEAAVDEIWKELEKRSRSQHAQEEN